MKPRELLRLVVYGDGKLLYLNLFVDRILGACRTGIAVLLIAGLSSYVPTQDIVAKLVAFSTFASLIAVSASDSSFGKVLHNVVAIFEVSMLAMVGTMAILRFIKPPMHLATTVACIGVCGFAIAYPSHVLIMGKKVGLTQICVTFISAHLNPNLDVVYMPPKLVASIFVGSGAAIISFLIPTPRLAAVQVKGNVTTAVRCLTELFKTMSGGFCTNDAHSLYSVRVHTKALRNSATGVINQLHEKQGDLWWECNSCCSIAALTHTISGITKLNLHVAGMELSLQSDDLLHSSPILRETMHESIESLVKESSLLLARAAPAPRNCFLRCFFTTREGAARIEEGKEALFLFDEAFMSARKRAYYSNLEDPPPMVPNIMSESSSSRVSPACLELEGLQMRGSPPKAPKPITTDTTNIPIITNSYEIPSSRRKFMARATTYFFLFNLRLYFEQAMQLVNPEYGSTVPGLEQWIPGLEQRTSGFISRKRNSATMMCNICDQMRMMQKLESGMRFRCCRALKTFFKPNVSQMKGALKISVALMLATTFGSLDLEGDAHQSWAAVTVSFIIGYHRGGFFRLAVNRTLGTTLGATYGYLAIRGAGDNGYVIMISLTLWILCAGFVRHSKRYSYVGYCAGITATSMILGDHPHEAQKYAIDRITQTFIGVFSFVLVEALVFPDHARTLVRTELGHSLIKLKNTIAEIVEVYTGEEAECLQCRNRHVEDIRKLERMLRHDLDLQAHLQEEAALEPELWFVPFPKHLYTRIVAIQGRMLDLLFFMVCSLQATIEDEHDQPMQRLFKPLQESLTFLKEEVTGTLDFLENLLETPAARKRHKMNFCCCERNFCCCERNFCCCHISVKFQLPKDADVEQPPGLQSIQVLDDRRRTIGGTPLSLRSSMDRFENSYEGVFEDIIAESKRKGDKIINSSMMLSISSLSFCLHALMREAVELEKNVYELLQAEHPWSPLDIWDTNIAPKPSKPELHEQP